jgi:fused signal recognition particle receptor
MAEPKSLLRRVFGGSQPTPADTPDTPVAAEADVAAEAEPTEKSERVSWFKRLKTGLARSSNALTDGIASILTKRKLDAAALEDLEDLLIRADLGPAAAVAITDALRASRYDKEVTGEEIKAILAGEIDKVLAPVARPLTVDPALKPHVVLVVGVNGTGKTTTIGKLAAKFREDGKSVVLAAGDTFRAAAIEQLKIWGERTGAQVVAGNTGADAAGLAFDALKDAKASAADILLIDTAGRLQNREELMAELEKVIRVIRKLDPSAPHTVLLTLDATTGQNAVNQVEIFGKRAGVTGLVMTKLDGTARGGILVAIAARYGLPVHFIGIGEGVDDLEPFSSGDFAKALAGL